MIDDSPLPIFLNIDPNQWLAGEILRYSLLKRVRREVQLIDCRFMNKALSKKRGPSFALFEIPEYQNYKGRAIYLETGTVVLDDISELVHVESSKPAVALYYFKNPHGVYNQGFNTNVVLLDCEKLTSWQPELWDKTLQGKPNLQKDTLWVLKDSLAHHDFSPLDPSWNSLDAVNRDTKIINYFDKKTLPWLSSVHPQKDIFLKELNNAIVDQMVSIPALLKEIALGHVYPDIIQDAATLSE